MLYREKLNTAVALALWVLFACMGLALPAEQEPPPLPFDNSLSLTGKLAKADDAANLLGTESVLVIRSAARWKQIQERLAALGWTKPPDDKDSLAKTDFTRQTIFGVVKYHNHGHIVNGFACHSVRGNANAAEVDFALSYTASMNLFAASSFNFAFVAIPKSQKTTVCVASFQPDKAPATGGTPESAVLEWKGEFDKSRGDWVDGLSATLTPVKTAISVGEEFRLKCTLIFSNAEVVNPVFFAKKLTSAFAWDEKYFNSINPPNSFMVEGLDGKSACFTDKPIYDWDKDAPHPVEITVDKPYIIPGGWEENMGERVGTGVHASGAALPGVYKITGIFTENSVQHRSGKRIENGPKMWGGDIASNTIEIEVKAK